jgi:two-component system chemotaxis sensor kinase CheA
MEILDSNESNIDEAMERELLGAFLQELDSTLIELERQLIELESGANDNLTNAIFRSFHNIKGSSSLLGHKILPEIMHYAESALNLVRQHKLKVTADLITLLLDVLTAMKKIAGTLKDTSKEGDERFFALLVRLDEVLKSEGKDQGDEHSEAQEAQEAAVRAEKQKSQGQDDDGLIKVSKGLIEQIMLTVGNFMTVENRFQYLKNKYSEDFDFVDNVTQLSDQLQKMQQAVLKMQLSSVKTVFTSLHRVVRTTASEVKKKINFETRGTETLIDRKILDQLQEPLIHMVRNAADHGIENADIRAASNKPAEGQITLEAFYRAGEVFVQLSDDGGGLNAEKLRKKAIEKNLITEDEASTMTDSDAYQLIFRPGFSSAERVTNISGRGVGMDVVRQAIDSIGGQIDIESRLGQGTTFILRLPLSLSIVECLEFIVSGQKYAVQQVNVEEVFSWESQTVRDGLKAVNHDSLVLNIRETPVPVLVLRSIFDSEDAKASKQSHYIVAKSGELRFCLCVDEIVGPCSLVTQPLPPTFATDAPFSGVANRGDGSLLFQVDLGKLANRVEARRADNMNGRKSQRATHAGASSDLRRITQKIIVFTVYKHFTLPVHAANQIITVHQNDIHEVNDRCYFTLDGQSIPMLWLEETLLSKERLKHSQYTIMVYTIENKTFGMSLGEFRGIHRMPAEFDDTLRSEGIMGSMVFENQTHLMLDMHMLTAKAFPNAIKRRADDRKVRRVLLAEDDAFFRGQIVSYLKANQYLVDSYEDGLEAKKALEDEEYAKTIDAIVSDIEMPRMDGIALLRYVKSMETLRHLPVIMLTAITTRDVVTKVLKSGAYAYVTKMHNSRVIQELKKLDAGVAQQHHAAPTEFATDRNIAPVERAERVVTFRVGGNMFAIRMRSIKEVSKTSHSARMNGFPGWMQRITSFRGKFIPVINLSLLFQFESKAETSAPLSVLSSKAASQARQRGAKIREQIILEENGSHFCIEVDGLGEVILLSQMRLGEGMPSLSNYERHVAQFVESIHKHGNELVCLINTKALESYSNSRKTTERSLSGKAA